MGASPDAKPETITTMKNRYALPALTAAVLAPLLVGCSSGPSYPHAWCGPLIARLHATQTRQAELSALASLQKTGAPVAQLIADEKAYAQNQVTAASTGTDSFGAVADAPKLLSKVTADLKALNSECGQPAGAYKSDNV